MSEPSKRSQKVAKMVQRKVAVALQQYTRDPRLNEIIITDIHLSGDLKNAKIYFTVLNKDHAKEIIQILKEETRRIRHILAKTTELRYVPELRFIYDQAIEQAEHLHKLIDEL